MDEVALGAGQAGQSRRHTLFGLVPVQDGVKTEVLHSEVLSLVVTRFQVVMAAGFFVVVVVLLSVEVKEESPPIIRDLDFNAPGDKLVLDFHVVSFPPGSGGRGHKQPGAYQPQTYAQPK